MCADKGYFTKQTVKKSYLKKGIQLIVPKKNYKKKKLKTKWYKRSIVRHSKVIKGILKERIKIEHVNNRIHRSFKRLHILYDKQITKFKAFIEMALSGLILEHI